MTNPDPATAEVTLDHQLSAWNGPEGANWAAWSEERVEHADLVPDLLWAASIQDRDRVLDLGCGIGELTRRAARQAHQGAALGIDISELMIARASELAAREQVANATFVAGDIATHEVRPGRFDIALSHFGVMFFEDPPAAFANVARALRPGGRLLCAVPADAAHCDWYGVPLAALYGHRPSVEEAPSAMFSLSRKDDIERILTIAGFDRVSINPLRGTFWFGRTAETAAARLVATGPVQSFLRTHEGWSRQAAESALSAALTPYVGRDGVRLPGDHWLIEAQVSAARP